MFNLPHDFTRVMLVNYALVRQFAIYVIMNPIYLITLRISQLFPMSEY